MFGEEQRSSPPIPCCHVNRQWWKKETLIEKKIAENLDFVENSNFIKGSTDAGFWVCPGVDSQESTCGGALF